MMAAGMDRPAAALLKDLAARGLLADTVVIWTTEFGRMPCSQGSKGRDHNPSTFTSWLAGGGIKGGTSFGKSDEWSFRAVENPTYVYDLHATVLELLGIDHKRLTFRHNGIDRRLTDVHGRVIPEILASPRGSAAASPAGSSSAGASVEFTGTDGQARLRRPAPGAPAPGPRAGLSR
jgi:hypothetical protein